MGWLKASFGTRPFWLKALKVGDALARSSVWRPCMFGSGAFARAPCSAQDPKACTKISVPAGDRPAKRKRTQIFKVTLGKTR